MAIQRKSRINRNECGFVEKAAIILITASLLAADFHVDLGVTATSTKTSLVKTSNISIDDNSIVFTTSSEENSVEDFRARVRSSRTYKSKHARWKFISYVVSLPKLIKKRSLNELVKVENEFKMLSTSRFSSENGKGTEASNVSTETLVHSSRFQTLTYRRSVEQGSCPKVQDFATCECSGHNVTCNDQNISNLSFREPIPKHFRRLSAIRSRMKAIPTFVNATELVLLCLRSNEIEILNVIALTAFPMLEELDLSHNNLANLDLSEVPLPHLSKLVVSSNHLTSFSSRSLNLMFLDLHNNHLSNISFVSQFTSLEHIDVSHNHISYIALHTFEHLIDLHYLNLRNNQIVQTEFLFNISKYLITLHLSNNRISNIPSMSLARSCIVSLFLANNSLTNVDFLIHMKNVAILNLNDNKRLKLNGQVFGGKTRLKKMDIAGLNLTSIDFVLEIPSLIALGVEENNIKCLPFQFFRRYKSLRTLYLSKNPLENLFCAASSFILDKVVEECKVLYKTNMSGFEVEILMQHENVTDYLNCMLKSHSEFLETCKQKCKSGVPKMFLSSFLFMFTVIMNFV